MLKGLSLLAASEAGAAVRRNLRWAALILAASLVAIGAIVFGLIALHSWLLMSLSPVEASLVIAAGLGIVALVLLIAAVWVRRSRRSASPLAATALVMAPTAMRLAARRLEPAAIGVAAVIAIGAIIGRSLARK
jgi:hypothetical protein